MGQRSESDRTGHSRLWGAEVLFKLIYRKLETSGILESRMYKITEDVLATDELRQG